MWSTGNCQENVRQLAGVAVFRKLSEGCRAVTKQDIFLKI